MANSNNSIDPVYSYLKAIVLLIVYLATLYEARAQVHLVKDMNTDPQSSLWGVPKRSGNKFYVGIYTNEYGNELWRTDGTTGGTVLVKDINPGWRDSNPQRLNVVNGILYFMADDGVHGTELWRSDGTPDGTYLFKDFEEGIDSPTVLEMTSTNDDLYLNIVKNNRSYLWRTNGVETSMVIDMGTIRELTSTGNAVYFFGDGSGNEELWRSEGTDETTIVLDVNGSNVNTGPTDLTNLNGTLYFSAFTLETGVELWKTDGTLIGTVLVNDIFPGASHAFPEKLTVSGNKLYFLANDGVKGKELWVTDGTTTQMVKDISPNSTSTTFGEMKGVNGSLYFTAENALGLELWKSDGTAAGTDLLKDVASGPTSSNPSNFIFAGNRIFFTAYDEPSGVELWSTDGTSNGTSLVSNINPGDEGSFPSSAFVVGSDLFFWADDGMHGSELWKSTSTGETTLVKDIATGSRFFEISNLVTDDNQAWFIEYGTGVWNTNGTTAGTKNIRSYYDDESNKNLLKTESGVYFVTHANDLNLDVIMFSDGQGEAIALQTHGFKSVNWMKELNGVLYFAADQNGTGMELWKSHRIIDDATLVKDINPGIQGSFPYAPFVYNGSLYFRASDGVHGLELWKTDGTASGTSMVKDIYAGSYNSNPQEFALSNGKIFFNAIDEAHGQEVWVSDGTESGTLLVKDIRPGNGWGNPLNFVDMNNVVYFFAYEEQHGIELWRTDGTEEGTYIVKDIHPTNDNYDESPDNLTVVDGTLYFSASDGEHGIELWTSDGTAAGTRMVRDITPGAQGSSLYWFTSINNRLFFAEGNEIWRSNGTECGTASILDGTGVQFYDNFMPVGSGNKMYFMGITTGTGAELYYYDFSTINDPGCLQTITFTELEPKLPIDPPFELHATSSSGLPVTFESSNNTVASILGNTVTVNAPGETTITASQAGNADFKAAVPVSQLLTVELITGLEEDPNKIISVYPNPATEYVIIDGTKEAFVSLMDINGGVITSSEQSFKLDVSNLPKGIYLVRVTTHEFSVTKRIVKN